MAYASVIQGAAVKCYVNGVLLGYVTAAAWNTLTRYGEAAEIDSNVVKEYMPGSYRVGGSFGILRGRSTGGLEGAGMVAFAEGMLRQKYLSIDLVDRVTGEVVERAAACLEVGVLDGDATIPRHEPFDLFAEPDDRSGELVKLRNDGKEVRVHLNIEEHHSKVLYRHWLRRRWVLSCLLALETHLLDLLESLQGLMRTVVGKS